MENKTKRIFKYDYVVQNEQIKPAVIQKKMDGEVVDNVGVYDKQFFPNSFFKFKPFHTLLLFQSHISEFFNN